MLASAANTSGVPFWVPGNAAIVPDAIDEGLIKESPAFHYLRKLALFRFPSDKSAFVDESPCCVQVSPNVSGRQAPYSQAGFGRADCGARPRREQRRLTRLPRCRRLELNKMVGPGKRHVVCEPPRSRSRLIVGLPKVIAMNALVQPHAIHSQFVAAIVL